ncbi:MAG: tetratricopeptide repeat protein [Candidatus Heimdallarchaeota archaeon]|nr:tetratricopeptide repeat protein [Candidatus Heimdallarchaeota archaeon]MDH5645004.1 tetratricopeptide repeat protein [Candidatus Heimdallarchaeota archaeon]
MGSTSQETFEFFMKNEQYEKLLIFCRKDNSIESKYWELTALSRLENYSELFEKQKSYEELFEKFGGEWEGKFYYFSGMIYSQIGKFQMALDYFIKALGCFTILDHKLDIAKSSFQIANMESLQGNFTNSMINYESSLAIFKEIGDDDFIGYSFANMTYIYAQQGELDLAFEYLSNVLKVYTNRDTSAKGICLIDAGKIKLQKGEIHEAIRFFNESLLIGEKHRLDFIRCQSIMMICVSELSKQNPDRQIVQNYLDKLLQIQQKNDDQMNRVFYHYTKAMYLKTSIRIRDKIKAEEMFHKIIEENDSIKEIQLDCIHNLIEILVFEYKATGEDEVLIEIQDQLDKILDISNKEFLYPRIIQAQIIRAKLTTITGDFEQAEQLLDDILEITIEKQLHGLKKKIEQEKINLLEEFKSMKRLIDENVSVSRKIDNLGLLDYIKFAGNMRLEDE